MSTPRGDDRPTTVLPQATSERPAVTTAPATRRARVWQRKLPARLGRARTSTVVIGCLFVLLFALNSTLPGGEGGTVPVTTSDGRTIQVPRSFVPSAPAPASTPATPATTEAPAPTTSAAPTSQAPRTTATDEDDDDPGTTAPTTTGDDGERTTPPSTTTRSPATRTPATTTAAPESAQPAEPSEEPESSTTPTG